MRKIEVTDEMVLRAAAEFERQKLGGQIWPAFGPILEAALNAPEEPVIEVTPTMQRVGGLECERAWHRSDASFAECAAAIYRTMERQRLNDDRFRENLRMAMNLQCNKRFQ